MRRTLALVAALIACANAAHSGEPAADERLVLLRSERTQLQARADAAARLELLTAFRIEGLLTDALSVREAGDSRALDQLPASRQQAFAALAALNAALKRAVAQPGDGAATLTREASERAGKALEALAVDDLPLVLQVTPRVVPPRRASELVIAPPEKSTPPTETALRLPPAESTDLTAEPPPSVVRYAPDLGAETAGDPAVEIQIAGRRLDGDVPPTLTVGDWRGEAKVEDAPDGQGRLRFSVPRRAFEGDERRAELATGVLALRREGRLVSFEMSFLVLPDRPGSVALDQMTRRMVPEANTLLSPEIMVRAPAGETRSQRRCFDPPAGWRFDKKQRRVVIAERLGWLGDSPDETLNGGTVEFADQGAAQTCLLVTAKPAAAGARTATIGRFEATLTRDQAEEKATQSGVRALDWNEPLRLPLEPEATERKLYVRLFGVVREFADPLPAGLPFLRLTREGDVLVLRADPSAEP